MTRSAVLRVVATMMASAFLFGCAHEQQLTNEAVKERRAEQDKTPAYRTYHVTGSRIARRTYGRAEPVTADTVMSTTMGGLMNMPGATINTKGF